MRDFWATICDYGGTIIITVSLLFIFSTLFLYGVSEKQVRSYYLMEGDTHRVEIICVIADMSNFNDPTVFCTPDVDKALDVQNKLNNDLKRSSCDTVVTVYETGPPERKTLPYIHTQNKEATHQFSTSNELTKKEENK